MNLVDSSGWIEYLVDGPHAGVFAKPLQNLNEIIVPTICLFEVFKKVLKEKNENEALQVAALMQQAKVIDLSPTIALDAARVSLDYQIPMADSIIWATAQKFEAQLWTQDSDFKDMKNVTYLPKN